MSNFMWQQSLGAVNISNPLHCLFNFSKCPITCQVYIASHQKYVLFILKLFGEEFMHVTEHYVFVLTYTGITNGHYHPWNTPFLSGPPANWQFTDPHFAVTSSRT